MWYTSSSLKTFSPKSLCGPYSHHVPMFRLYSKGKWGNVCCDHCTTLSILYCLTFPSELISCYLSVSNDSWFFSFRYLTNGASCLKSDKKVLKENYEDLRNSLDLVGFTDEVSMSNYTYRINKQKDMSFKSHLHVLKWYKMYHCYMKLYRIYGFLTMIYKMYL